MGLTKGTMFIGITLILMLHIAFLWLPQLPVDRSNANVHGILKPYQVFFWVLSHMAYLTIRLLMLLTEQSTSEHSVNPSLNWRPWSYNCFHQQSGIHILYIYRFYIFHIFHIYFIYFTYKYGKWHVQIIHIIYIYIYIFHI